MAAQPKNRGRIAPFWSWYLSTLEKTKRKNDDSPSHPATSCFRSFFCTVAQIHVCYIFLLRIHLGYLKITPLHQTKMRIPKSRFPKASNQKIPLVESWDPHLHPHPKKFEASHFLGSPPLSCPPLCNDAETEALPLTCVGGFGSPESLLPSATKRWSFFPESLGFFVGEKVLNVLLMEKIRKPLRGVRKKAL